MGASLEVVQIASATPPGEIRWISAVEAARLSLTTRDASPLSELWETKKRFYGVRMEAEFLQPDSRVVSFALTSCPIYLTVKGKKVIIGGSEFQVDFYRGPSEEWVWQIQGVDRIEFVAADGRVARRAAVRPDRGSDSSYVQWSIDPTVLATAFEHSEVVTLRLHTPRVETPIEFIVKRTNFEDALRRFRLICGF